jgi:hypothetical protein
MYCSIMHEMPNLNNIISLRTSHHRQHMIYKFSFRSGEHLTKQICQNISNHMNISCVCNVISVVRLVKLYLLKYNAVHRLPVS